jgi:hypothetical protein
MTIRALLGAFVLVHTAAVRGSEQLESKKDEEILLFSTRMDGGAEFEYRVSRAALDSTPSWRPLEADPPLTPHEAARIAASHAKPQSPDKVAVIAFDLSAVRSDLDSELRWYYTVSFYDLDQTYRKEPPDSLYLVILMDGSVVEHSTKNH